HHAVPESFFPIPGQTPLTERENARPQVEEVPVRKNQEAAVVDYQLQAAVVLAGSNQSSDRARRTSEPSPKNSAGRAIALARSPRTIAFLRSSANSPGSGARA